MRLLLAVILTALFAPAATAKPPLRTVDTGSPDGALVVDAEVDGAVYLKGSELIARRDAGTVRRRYPLAAPCEPRALSKETVGLRCPDGPSLLSLRTGAVHRIEVTLPVPGRRVIDVSAVGKRWMRIEGQGPSMSGYDVGDYLVNRRTGKVIDLREDPFGRRRVLDLDRPSGARRLCGGLERHRYQFSTVPPYLPSTMVGGSFLELEADHSRPITAGRLTDCRTGRARRTASGFSLAVANAGYLIEAQRSFDDRFIAVRAITGTRSWRFPYTSALTAPAQALLSAGALWIRRFDGTVQRARLPKR